MKVPFVDLQPVWEELRQDLTEAFERVMSGGMFILGSEVEAFEKEFAAWCGTEYAVGMNSGTDALTLSLLACGIGPGDEVITVPNTFIATVLAIISAGARPVFVDVREKDLLMDVSALRKVLTPNTRAIIPVHLFGRMVRMEPLLKFAAEHGLTVIEDACQSHGARQVGCRAGAFSDAGCFSFYPAKNLGAFGDAGMVATSNELIYRKLLKLRNYGQERKYHHDTFGVNSRLDELQAALLRVKLPHLDRWNEERRALASLYRKCLAGLPISIPADSSAESSVYHLFVLRTPDRDRLADFLASHGIQTQIHYPVPVHLQKSLEYLGLRKGSFPMAEKAATQIISLPLYPGLPEEQVEYVCENLRAYLTDYA